MTDAKRPLKVFLCHASADKPKVRELYRTLKRRGVQPWLDAEDLIPGQNWEVEIPKALLSSDAIIICLSPNSVDKEGYVQKEIKFALDKAMEMPEGRIFLIPARLEECDLPFSLSKYQAVNLYEKAGYTKLMQALKLRASQLERAIVELPKAGETTAEMKKVVEEKETPKSKDGKSEAKITEPSLGREGVKSSLIVADNGDIINTGNWKEYIAEKPAAEQLRPKRTKPSRKPNTTIIVALIGLAGTIITALIGSPLIEKWFSPAPVITQSVVSTTKVTPKPLTTPLLTASPTNTPTPVVILTPTNYNDSLPIEITDDKGMTMRLVPAGEFIMGSDKGSDDERPVHQVYLDSFYMDIYEVTNFAYEACVTAGGCSPPQNNASNTRSSYYGYSRFDNYPVILVNWYQASSYCAWRDASLPTEAQWEKAARGTDGRTYPWGEVISCTQANYNNGGNQYCVGDTTEVGSFSSGKSPYGMYDMAGNVWEWVADWYDENYYDNSLSSNPFGPDSGQYRVLRGGSWSSGDINLRSADRVKLKPGNIIIGIGFRCVKDANP